MDAIPGAGGSGALLGGRYEVGALVGLGGTARVYRARDGIGDTTVAVKIFPAGSEAGPGGDGSQELAVLSGMQHPALVGVRDSGVDDEGHPFVVMDFVEGQSLAARLRDGVLSAPAAMRLGVVLADALAYVHARGIVHRDVKPGNVIITPTGEPVLLDFGLARTHGEDSDLTVSGAPVGTPAYMSPEQIAGLPVDGRSDLYALGVLLFHLLCGRLPHEAPTLGALMSVIAGQTAPNLRDLRPDAPQSLAEVVARVLSKRPVERPADAAELARALQSAASNVKFSRADPRHNSAD